MPKNIDDGQFLYFNQKTKHFIFESSKKTLNFIKIEVFQLKFVKTEDLLKRLIWINLD